MGKEELDAVAAVFEDGWLGMGPRVEEFERAFAAYLDVPYVIAVNSCTAALDLATLLLGIGPDDEVLVPTMTFVSTAHVVLYRGARVVFVDVDPATLQISLEDAARKVTRRTRAVIPVHYGGGPVDVRALREAVGPGISVIEDCAHATGAEYYGRKVGAEGDIACFSFHAVKNLAMGDGGALVVRSAEQYERARRLRWMGINRSTWDRVENDRGYRWEYDVEEIGYKCQMNDIAAAIGLVQLRKLVGHNSRREEIARMYNQGLEGFVQIPPPLPGRRSAWHLYAIQADRRDQLADHLSQQGISTSVHYRPLHLHSCYAPQPPLLAAEAAAERVLSLPLFPTLPNEAVERIISEIRSFTGGIRACPEPASGLDRQ